jgi:DNA-binding response OmpR family regulator
VSQKPRVLVVEDDLDSYDALARILKHVGYDTLSAATLAEGEELLAQSPRFVVLDLMLPDGNGKDLLQQVRDQQLPIKVAVITAMSDNEVLEDVRRLKADGLFLKPLDVPRLLAWLRQGGAGGSDL